MKLLIMKFFTILLPLPPSHFKIFPSGPSYQTQTLCVLPFPMESQENPQLSYLIAQLRFKL
jgi:hypothetical protein